MDDCVNAYCDPESPCDDCYNANIDAALAEMGIFDAERAAESMADRWDDEVTMREFLVDCE